MKCRDGSRSGSSIDFRRLLLPDAAAEALAVGEMAPAVVLLLLEDRTIEEGDGAA